jgi:hypothetical protein
MSQLTPSVLKGAIALQGLIPFLRNVTIACRPVPRPFGEVADPWQWDKIIYPLAPAIEYVAGKTQARPRYKSYWVTLTKGSDKTSVIARTGHYICNWASRWTGMSVWASDRKQAKLLRDAMMDEHRLNDWFPDTYRIDNYRAEGPTGFVEINSSDAEGGHGTRSNIYVADEVTVWENPKVWDMVQSSVTKYSDNVLIVLCNAGWKHTWQHRLRNQFEAEFLAGDTTYFWEPHGIQASWTDRREVEKTRAKISPSEGRRLYDNLWVDSAEESAFDEDLINAMFQPGLGVWDDLIPRVGQEDPASLGPEIIR